MRMLDKNLNMEQNWTEEMIKYLENLIEKYFLRSRDFLKNNKSYLFPNLKQGSYNFTK